MATSDYSAWKLTERTVAMVERFIAPPGASVKHDQFLPELTTGNMRQCDVVIRTGVVPRQTLTIVEVQKRGRKVELSHFDGWCEKRKQLGAQHLICVSPKGFPASVLARAALEGDTVRLVTLKGAETPLPFTFPRVISWDNSIMNARDVTLVYEEQLPEDGERPKLNAPVFLAGDRSQPVSVEQVVEHAKKSGILLDVTRAEGTVPGEYSLTYRIRLSELPPLRYQSDDRPLMAVELAVRESWRHHRYEVPIEVCAYEQIGFGDTLAWVVMAAAEHEGEAMSVRFPVQCDKQGRVRIGRAEMSALKGHTMMRSHMLVLADPPA